MNEIALKVKSLKKVYRLGQIGTGTISHDLNKWFDKIRGRENRYTKIGEKNDRSSKSGTNSYVNVLDDINFEIPKGEVVGIIGKNGAGKSTLLKVISQITSPTSGTIKANGRIASLLEVGTGMHPEMSGKENVYLNGTILGMTKKEIDEKYDEIMDFAGCAKYADTPVKRYSSGMKVRLGFAVAAFLEPEILIVDEVLAVGDAEFQKKAIGKMQDISKGGGRTVLFVSHNMASIQNLCSRVIVLQNGKVDFFGETNKAIEFYLKQSENSKKSDFSNRVGSGEVKLKKVKLDIINGEENINSVLTALPVILTFTYVVEKNIELLGNLRLGVGVFSSNGTLITILNSDFCNYLFPSRIGCENFSIKCSLSKLPLAKGSYYLKTTLAGAEIIDQVDEAFWFSVEAGDFFGTGKVSNIDKPIAFFEQSWS